MTRYNNAIPIILLSIFTTLAVFPQAATAPVQIEDILDLKTVKDPQLSPDGAWIAYTVSEMDIKKDKSETRIWMVPANGGEAIAMTGKGYSASRPRWSPDNKYLTFLASKSDADKTQLWQLNRLGGEAEPITKVVQGVASYDWSPKGDQILLAIRDAKPEELTEDKEDDKKAKPYVIDRLQFKQDYVGYLDRYRTHYYVQQVGDTIPVQITSGDFEDSEAAWSPDGTSIAFVSNRTKDADGNSNTDIWIVAADTKDKGKNLQQLTTEPNADTDPEWSPDGKQIVYKTITDPTAIWYATIKMAVIPATGGNRKLLLDELDRSISNPSFTPDGKSIYFRLEESGTDILAAVDLNGKNFRRVVAGDFSIADYDQQGSKLALLLGKANVPYEVYTFQDKKLEQRSHTNDQMFAGLRKPVIEKIHFNSKDGTEIEGFVVKPINFDPAKKYPTILWLHGGPVAQYQFEYDSEPQLFAANSYVTLLINPRGSSGYGQAFSQALFAEWGIKDFEDVMAGVDHAIAAGYTDPDKLGVGGWSYGGILTNYVITKSDRFKGAISGASEALYRSNYGHDHYQLTWELELGLPWENAEGWEKISPFNDVAKITTPTLWIGGQDDWNVPILNSEQMYQAMKRLGRETQLVVYPGEHHGIRKPSFVKDRLERYLAWFEKYVKGTPADSTKK